MSESLTKLREALKAGGLLCGEHCRKCNGVRAALVAVEQEMAELRAAAKRWDWIRANARLTTDEDAYILLIAQVADSLEDESPPWLKDDETSALTGAPPLELKIGRDDDSMLAPGAVYRGDTLERAVDANIAAEVQDARPIEGEASPT